MLLRSTLRALDRLTSRLGRAPERAPHLVSGSRGEEEAYFHLRKLGFVIVARDYRSPRRRGDIDLIASDHSPCPPEMKATNGDLFAAWGGIASLQLSLGAVWTGARARGIAVERVRDWMCEQPARLAGLDGCADHQRVSGGFDS